MFQGLGSKCQAGVAASPGKPLPVCHALLHRDLHSRIGHNKSPTPCPTLTQVSRLALPVFMARCDAVLRTYAEDQARVPATPSMQPR